MNVYVVVEGSSTEPQVYRSWIPLANPSLKVVDYIDQVVSDNFYIVSGGGYPYIFNVIDNAIADINSNLQFDRLVVAIDSEEKTYIDTFNEIDSYIAARHPRIEYRIIIQHFCFETWALGHRKFGPRRPRSDTLKAYKKLHDVLSQDPELLPANDVEELNRAQFALKYLCIAIQDKGRHLTYSKRKPDVVLHPKYFSELQSRLDDTGHISSFSSFLAAFEN